MSKKSKVVTIQDVASLLEDVWVTMHDVEQHLNDEVENAKVDQCDTAPERLAKLKALRKRVRFIISK